MLSDSAIISLILDNLSSPYGYPAALLVDRILTRPVSELPNVPTSRVYDASQNPMVIVPDFNALTTLMAGASIVTKPLMLGTSTNNTPMVSVTFPTIRISVNRRLGSDSWLVRQLSAYDENVFSFHLGYSGDNDVSLPLKIRAVHLLNAIQE